MRILGVHNYYGSSAPSGENVVFDAEMDLLKRRGHDVRTFTRSSDSIRGRGAIGAIQGALSTPWNPFSAKAIAREVIAFKPDVVHVHNTFPLISPSIFSAIGHRAARILTLHNYRLVCPAAIPLRAGQVCTDCLDSRSVIPALKFGCYRNSRIATVPLAANVALNRWLGTWQREVDAFVALSSFQQGLMAQAGLPGHRIHVKPNFFPGCPQPTEWARREPYVVFVGRLSPEKGVEHLVKAWLAWGASAPNLRLLGDGPLRHRLQKLVDEVPAAKILFAGQLPSTEAEIHIAGARLLILPSTWFEGFPMVIREAYAYGTPVAVSNIGPLPTIVKDGFSGIVFEPGSADALLQRVRDAWEAPGLLERLARGARAEYESHYNEDANYETLMRIYEAAVHKEVTQ